MTEKIHWDNPNKELTDEEIEAGLSNLDTNKMSTKQLAPEAQSIVEEVSADLDANEPGLEASHIFAANKEFLDKAFAEDSKANNKSPELSEHQDTGRWSAFLSYLESKTDLQPLRFVLGKPKSWEEFRNAMEMADKNNRPVAMKLMTEYAKFIRSKNSPK